VRTIARFLPLSVRIEPERIRPDKRINDIDIRVGLRAQPQGIRAEIPAIKGRIVTEIVEVKAGLRIIILPWETKRTADLIRPGNVRSPPYGGVGSPGNAPVGSD